MKRFLLLCILGMAAALPCRSQDTILLREGGATLTGRVLWDKSRGDRLFYDSVTPQGDSLQLFIPRRKVEYVVRADDSRMIYRGREKGWQPWRGRTFNEVPQQRMQYGAAWSTILDGWSADASVLRMMNRNYRVGIGAFVRYLSTRPSRDDYFRIVTYDHQAVAFGPQVEIRGYSRRLKTFFYVDIGPEAVITTSSGPMTTTPSWSGLRPISSRRSFGNNIRRRVGPTSSTIVWAPTSG